MALAEARLEEIETAQMLQERLKTPKEEYLNGDDVLKRLNLSLDD